MVINILFSCSILFHFTEVISFLSIPFHPTKHNLIWFLLTSVNIIYFRYLIFDLISLLINYEPTQIIIHYEYDQNKGTVLMQWYETLSHNLEVKDWSSLRELCAHFISLLSTILGKTLVVGSREGKKMLSCWFWDRLPFTVMHFE